MFAAIVDPAIMRTLVRTQPFTAAPLLPGRTEVARPLLLRIRLAAIEAVADIEAVVARVIPALRLLLLMLLLLLAPAHRLRVGAGGGERADHREQGGGGDCETFHNFLLQAR